MVSNTSHIPSTQRTTPNATPVLSNSSEVFIPFGVHVLMYTLVLQTDISFPTFFPLCSVSETVARYAHILYRTSPALQLATRKNIVTCRPYLHTAIRKSIPWYSYIASSHFYASFVDRRLDTSVVRLYISSKLTSIFSHTSYRQATLTLPRSKKINVGTNHNHLV